MRILIRTSRWAIWARRLGGFALPLAIISVFLHRSKAIDTDTFHITFGLAVVCGLLAFFMGLVAFFRLWGSGDKGWRRATAGVLFGAFFVGLTIYAVLQGTQYPQTVDVWTDRVDPPELVMVAREMPTGSADFDTIAQAFPNAVNRTYQLESSELFGLIEELIADLEWDVRVKRLPDALGRPGQINASVTTLFGWQDEVSIRLTVQQNRTIVAMRSASMYGLHDLGVNGKRIESFLLNLDRKISEIIRDRPAQN